MSDRCCHYLIGCSYSCPHIKWNLSQKMQSGSCQMLALQAVADRAATSSPCWLKKLPSLICSISSLHCWSCICVVVAGHLDTSLVAYSPKWSSVPSEIGGIAIVLLTMLGASSKKGGNLILYHSMEHRLQSLRSFSCKQDG